MSGPRMTITESIVHWFRTETMPLPAFLDELNAGRTRMTDEQFANAKVDLSDGDYGDSIRFSISFERPETDAEYEARLVRDQAERAQRAAQQEAHERWLLAQLSAKYGQPAA